MQLSKRSLVVLSVVSISFSLISFAAGPRPTSDRSNNPPVCTNYGLQAVSVEETTTNPEKYGADIGVGTLRVTGTATECTPNNVELNAMFQFEDALLISGQSPLGTIIGGSYNAKGIWTNSANNTKTCPVLLSATRMTSKGDMSTFQAKMVTKEGTDGIVLNGEQTFTDKRSRLSFGVNYKIKCKMISK